MPMRYPASIATDEPRPLPWPLLQRGLRVGQPPLLRDALCYQGYLPVEEQEAGHAVPGYQAELLLQTLLDPS